MCSERRTEVKIGTSKVSISSFGNLLITEKYLEHYFMVNLMHEGKIKKIREIPTIRGDQ